MNRKKSFSMKSSLMRKVSIAANKFVLHKNVNLIVFTLSKFSLKFRVQFYRRDKISRVKFILPLKFFFENCYCVKPLSDFHVSRILDKVKLDCILKTKIVFCSSFLLKFINPKRLSPRHRLLPLFLFSRHLIR